VLGVERGGVYRTVNGFEWEVVGEAVDSALRTYQRTRSFPSSPAARQKLQAATDALRTPATPTTPIESLVVALKCHQTLPVMRQLAPRLSPESCVVLLQNGMGVYDELCASLWPDPARRPQFILGSTTHGARMRTQQAFKGGKMERGVVHTGLGGISWGIVPDPRGKVDYERLLFPAVRPSITTPTPAFKLPLPSLSPTANASTLDQTLAALLSLTDLQPALLPIQELYHTLLLKLAINSAVNPLTALLGVQNGALLGPEHAHTLIRSILDEASAVITAYLAHLDRATPLSAETKALFSPEAMEARTTEVLTATARNTSSMASDFQRLGTPQSSGTEIDYINGFLVRLGERMGMPTPVNAALLRLVQAKEEVAGVSPNLLLRPVNGNKGKR
jgi:2-dehydropantoate 2-reductase